MRWNTAQETSELIPLPPGYAFEQLQGHQVPELVAKIQHWHPDISIGGGSCFLREDFYREKVFLAGEAEKDIFVLLIKFDGEMVGMWSYERELDALTIYGRLLIVAPPHRGSKVALHCMSGTERVCRACGAEFVYTLATLKVPHMQVALERAGYQLLGFAPGYDREVVGNGDVRRVFEAVYGKVLVSQDAILLPDAKNLTPKALALFEMMFPGGARNDEHAA
ncbi:MAG: GNAT family N-acetyltransferase [Polaromonas sp.]